MGCSVLHMIFQLEILFVYTLKMSRKERFSLSVHIRFLQLVTSLPNSGKGGANGHILVSSPWSGSFKGPNIVFSP